MYFSAPDTITKTPSTMPTYDYICSACGHAWEEFQQMSHKPLKLCPKCKAKKAQRQIGAGGLIGLAWRKVRCGIERHLTVEQAAHRGRDTVSVQGYNNLAAKDLEALIGLVEDDIRLSLPLANPAHSES